MKITSLKKLRSVRLRSLCTILAIFCITLTMGLNCSRTDGFSASSSPGTNTDQGNLAVSEARIWFAPQNPLLTGQLGKPEGGDDFFSLFQSPNQWPNAMGHTSIFAVGVNFLQHATNPELSSLFSFLNAHGIALALEYGALPSGVNAGGQSCGSGEGYGSTPQLVAKLSGLITSNGGTLSYIAMDEPVYFGHYATGIGGNQGWPACQYSFTEMAQQTAATLQQFKAFFPNVTMGEIEPPLAFSGHATWLTDMATWISAYQAASGVPLAFFHYDVDWGHAWPAPLAQLSSLLNANQIPVGVIANGNGTATSDSQWMNQAETNIRAYLSSGLPPPSDIVVQSWVPYPSNSLPETTETALTYLIDYLYTPAADVPAPTLFYAMYNATLNQYFYTSSINEMQNNLAVGWSLQPALGYIELQAGAAPGLTPLYRMANSAGHFFTASQTEEQAALTAGSTLEGIAGYVFATAANPNLVPVYRAFNSTNGHYFYTTNTQALSALAPPWTSQGIQFYVDNYSTGIGTGQQIYGLGGISLSSGGPSIALDHGALLSLGSNGNLLVTSASGATLWTSRVSGVTCAPGGCTANFQGDGNLVIIAAGKSVWTSGTSGTGTTLSITAEPPYLQIFGSANQSIWTAPL